MGIVGIILIPILPSIAAIVLGVMARREIRREPARYSGDGLAIGGLIAAGVGLAFWLGVIVLIFAAAAGRSVSYG